MDIDFEIAQAASRRWAARTAERSVREDALARGDLFSADEPGRIIKRLKRLGEMATQERAGRATPHLEAQAAARAMMGSSLVDTIGRERVMGDRDFLGINFLEMALAVSRFVGRIRIRTRVGGPNAGYGTGFMVSPCLLLTNNHVLPDATLAAASEVEFDYQYDRAGRLLPVVNYGLEPQRFFLTSVKLDYTLVAVRERSVDDRTELRRYGWTRLIEEQGKAVIGDALNIIQHPQGEPKQLVLRSNKLIDLFDHFAHYVTDTDRGSSGSPVYNDQWEVVALHHQGVPRVENGQYLKKDGTVWREGMDPEELEWVANEGVRISSIVADIRSRSIPEAWSALRGDLLDREPPNPMDALAETLDPSPPAVSLPPAAPAPGGGSYEWTIPLKVRVELGAPLPTPSTGPVAVPVGGGTQPPGALPPAAAGSGTSAPRGPDAANPELRSAIAELERAAARPYYDEAADEGKRVAYYRGVPAEGPLFRALGELVQSTHSSTPGYQPATHVYPWVDLQEEGGRLVLKSVYSGRTFDPREFIEEDFRIQGERARMGEMLARESSAGAFGAEQADLLEATLPYNCEHVVPQSWFNKKEPMRGDLHHLFACESGCNSFRGNIPYFDFVDYEEAVREACGKREELKFEPAAGKGAVARATLYFLLRYPGQINRTGKEYTEDRIQTLVQWHQRFPVTRYEKHRNAAIHEKQGNRNPLIDHPEWVSRIDFIQGLG